MITKLHKGFTLVELIIVIVILSILWVISFLGFSQFVSNARDGNRLTDIKNIKKAIDIFSIETWWIPKITNTLSTISTYWKDIIYVWEIDDDLQKLLKIHGLKKDSITGKNYLYWVNTDYTKFEIAWFLEKERSVWFLQNTYADLNEYNSIVDGDYNGMIKFSTWWNVYLTNPPGLIINNSWSVNLLWSDEVYFITDGWRNIYYNIQNIDWANTILQEQYWSGAMLTWVNINTITSENIATEFSEVNGLLQSFWGDIEKIWTEIFGQSTSIVYNSCTYSGNVFAHNTQESFYKKQEAYSCLNEAIIYKCINGDVFDEENNPITSVTEYEFDSCVDETSCKFGNGNLFNGTCHF